MKLTCTEVAALMVHAASDLRTMADDLDPPNHIKARIDRLVELWPEYERLYEKEMGPFIASTSLGQSYLKREDM